MIAVLDSNVAIGLAKGECLGLIRALFQRVVVPPVVRREVIEEAHGRPGGHELQEALGVWIDETAPAAIMVRAAIPAVKPLLDLMQARAYYIEPSVYSQALEMAGEGH